MEISFPIIYLYTILFISQYFVQDIIRMTFMGTRYDAHSIKSSDVLYAYLDVTTIFHIQLSETNGNNVLRKLHVHTRV